MINLLGIPFDANSSFLRGSAMAPAHIRKMDTDGSANRFAENGIEIVEGEIYTDLGDLVFENDMPESAFHQIRSKVLNHLQSGRKLLCLGGDHSVSFPIIDAFTELYHDLHVLHFDAHTDLYDNFENNPFSHASPFARLMEKGKVQSLLQVGIRTLTTHQKEQAKKFGVDMIEMKDLHFEFLNRLPSPLYISLDIDVLDPAYAPGVSHHEPGGMSTRQLLHILQHINVNVIGGDIVEMNPDRDINGLTAMVGYKLMKEMLALMMK